MEITTIPVQYATAILNAAVYRGLDRDKLLHEAGISPELLDNSKARLSSAMYVRFSHIISEHLHDELGGFMNTPCKPGTFEMMCYACINCPTLEAFLRRGIKFYSLITDSIHFELHRDDEQAHYILDTSPGSNDPDHFLPFTLLSVIHRLSSWVIDQPLILQSVNFSHRKPETANQYNYLFKSPIKFNQPHNSLVFSSNYLDLPVQQSDQTLQTFLNKPVLQLMAGSSSDNSLVITIKRLIKDSVSTEFPEFEIVARQLNATTVTLRRRLRSEGSSYQQIKDDLRRDTAIFNLGRGSMSIEQVAESVGFSEPTSFFRAFKRWTGITPRAYITNKPSQ